MYRSSFNAGKNPYSIAINENRREFLVADAGSNLVRVFDLQGNQIKKFTTKGLESPCSIAINSQGHIYVGSEDGMVRVFNQNYKLLFGFKTKLRNALNGLLIDQQDKVIVVGYDQLSFFRANGSMVSTIDPDRYVKKTDTRVYITDMVINSQGEIVCTDYGNKRLLRIIPPKE